MSRFKAKCSWCRQMREGHPIQTCTKCEVKFEQLDDAYSLLRYLVEAFNVLTPIADDIVLSATLKCKAPNCSNPVCKLKRAIKKAEALLGKGNS